MSKKSMDTLTKTERSVRMAKIRNKNTKPELAVRNLLQMVRNKYLLHAKNLPGCPDVVFPVSKKIIFIHGCFWHRHYCKNGQRTPKTRTAFWKAKLNGNKKRDQRVLRQLNRSGWSYLIFWECQLKDMKQAEKRLRRFLKKKRGETL